MTDLVTDQPVFMLSAHKDVLRRAFENAPDSRDRDSVLQLIERIGMADSPVAFTAAQREYIRTNGAALMDHPSIKGTKLDHPLAREVMDSIVSRMGRGQGS